MALIKTNARGQSSNLGRRNMLRNGAMNVEQRGTTFSQTTGQVYTLDGFLATVGSSFNMDTTVTQSSTVPTGEGFTKAIKVTPDSVVSSSGSDNGGIAQRLEVQNVNHLGWGTSSAKNLTLSFWVRSSKTGIYCVQLQQNVAAAGTAVYSHVKEYTIATADTWQKVILTFSGNTTQSAAGADAADGLRVNWWLVCGSNDHTAADSWLQSGSYLATSNQVDFMDNTSNTWYMTGCQLEAGDTATDFEHRSYGEELLLCQRYCFVLGNSPSAAHRFATGLSNNSTTVYAMVHHPVIMRSLTTLTVASMSNVGVSNASTGTALTGLVVQGVVSSTKATGLTATTAGGLTAARPYFIEGTGAHTPINLVFNAEL